MTIVSRHFPHALAIALAALLASAPSFAAGQAQAPAATGAQADYGVKLGAFFKEEDKKAARAAFAQRYGKGKDCPAGMERGAKGCAAPVEGRYWAVGQTLQPAVKPNPVPEPVKAKLPPVPQGYEYLMAGDDILLVSKGLHLVVDILEDVTG